jgi:gamma-butyrobetaine dioxygenase
MTDSSISSVKRIKRKACEMKLQSIKQEDTYLAVEISGTVSRFHYLWLRDNCPGNRSPNGQKLHETNQLDPDVQPSAIEHTDEELTITWSDGALSGYPVNFLANWRYDNTGANADEIVLWNRDIENKIARHDYDDVCSTPGILRLWLRDVATFGFGLLCNVPAVERKIFDVVALFGFVRDTNYGKLFEVRTEENPSNLAYTPLPLSVHTDNPYRDPCPSLQLLHCLVQSEQGGLTALSDGFYAAEQLRQESPDAFDLLTKHEVSFHYESETAVLDNRDKIINLNSDGSIRKIRINNRSIAPLQLPFEIVTPFYEALSAFRSILESEKSQYRFLMQPGDLLLLDNERVLHGRAGECVGARHLQGCYADRDGLLSTLKILEKKDV